MQASQKLGEMMYAKMQAEQGAQGEGVAGAGGDGQQAGESKAGKEEDVVDADFKEVKRDA